MSHFLVVFYYSLEESTSGLGEEKLECIKHDRGLQILIRSILQLLSSYVY